MKKIITIFFILLSFSVHSIDIDQIEPLTKKANDGYADAQFHLGMLYSDGKFLKPDYYKAFKYYKLAAEQGHRSAQNNLAVLYEDGNGTIKNQVEAIKYYQLAAQQAYAPAQYNLGILYYKGDGVEKDIVISKSWFKKSCDNGNIEGCNAYEKLEKSQ